MPRRALEAGLAVDTQIRLLRQVLRLLATGQPRPQIAQDVAVVVDVQAPDGELAVTAVSDGYLPFREGSLTRASRQRVRSGRWRFGNRATTV